MIRAALTAALLLTLLAPAASAQQRCEQLVGAKIGSANITAAASIPEGPFMAPNAPTPAANAPATNFFFTW